MSTPNKLMGFAIAGMFLAALPLWAKAPHKLVPKASPKAAPPETATIENTGSTNTKGYQIIVSADGSASYQEMSVRGASPSDAPKPRVQALPKAVTTKLFADLAAVGPMAALPARHGMRSVSFGTETFVTYKGQRSPDLTFPATPQALAVRDDAAAIAQTLHLGGMRRPLSRPMLP